ncbi:MAG: PPC domain-containing protein, partial [Deinococcus sp.]|nr:PPC domain-containing protein [Deinococcus sp.]
MGLYSHLPVPRPVTLLGAFLVVSLVAAQVEATLSVAVIFQGTPVPPTDLQVVLASTTELRFFGPVSENPAVFTVEPGTYIVLASAGSAQVVSPNITLAAGESRQVTVELLPFRPPLMPTGTPPARPIGEQPPPQVEEPPATPASELPTTTEPESTSIAIGEAVTGTIPDNGMPVFYTFTGTAGTIIHAEVFASREGSALDSTLSLFDSEGNELAANDDSDSRDSLIEYELPVDDLYTLRLEDLSESGGADYFFRLELSQIITFSPLPVPEGDINLAALEGVQLEASSIFDSLYGPEQVV